MEHSNLDYGFLNTNIHELRDFHVSNIESNENLIGVLWGAVSDQNPQLNSKERKEKASQICLQVFNKLLSVDTSSYTPKQRELLFKAQDQGFSFLEKRSTEFPRDMVFSYHSTKEKRSDAMTKIDTATRGAKRKRDEGEKPAEVQTVKVQKTENQSPQLQKKHPQTEANILWYVTQKLPQFKFTNGLNSPEEVKAFLHQRPRQFYIALFGLAKESGDPSEKTKNNETIRKLTREILRENHSEFIERRSSVSEEQKEEAALIFDFVNLIKDNQEFKS